MALSYGSDGKFWSGLLLGASTMGLVCLRDRATASSSATSGSTACRVSMYNIGPGGGAARTGSSAPPVPMLARGGGTSSTSSGDRTTSTEAEQKATAAPTATAAVTSESSSSSSASASSSSTAIEQANAAATASGGSKEVTSHYDSKYQQWQLSMNEFGSRAQAHYWREFVRPDTRCAEFGSSSGHIISSLRNQEVFKFPAKDGKSAPQIGCSLEAIGVEVNPAARDHADTVLRPKFGINATVDNVEKLPDDTYDLILTHHVLEHLECALCELRKIYKKVKPRTGVFVAVVPWYTELAETYDGKDINQHLAGFGAQELGNLMTKAGFSVSGEECHSYHREWPSNYQFWFNALPEWAWLAVQSWWSDWFGNGSVETRCVGRKM